MSSNEGEYVSINGAVFKEPISVSLNLNMYPMGTGFKEIKITIDEIEFVFTKEEIKKLLLLAKKPSAIQAEE